MMWIAGGVIVAVYAAVAVYFSFHFYAGTQIYGVDCGMRTADTSKRRISQKITEYELTIQERGDKSETVMAGQINLEFVDDTSVDRMLEAQKAYLWPVMMLLPGEGTDAVAFQYDRDLAIEQLNKLDCMNVVLSVAPRNAFIEPTDSGFEIIKEVMGTTLNYEKAKAAYLEALDAGVKELSLEEKGCYVEPEIYSNNETLISDAEAMSELARAHITYQFGSSREVVDASVIQDWIVKTVDGSFVIDETCVFDYVTSLAAKYDTFGLPVDFYTSIGTTVTLAGGDYGWCIDQNATAVALLNALQSSYRGEMEPVYLYSAMSWENNCIGYTYVEICISQQRMWCYENGTLLVDTPVVTGNPNKGNATPAGGVWAIDAKKRDAILTGEGYTSPVDYWLPFNGDIGIHDLKERAYFGGSIYLTNGSHGCVNTPYDQVQIIYDTVSIGTPVIVYD